MFSHNSPPSSQRGQSLLAALILAALVMLFGYTLIKLHGYQTKMMVESKRKDRLFSVGDYALQRALSVMVKGDQATELWDDVNDVRITGYSSITFTGTVGVVTTPHTDLSGTEYWINILPGDLGDTYNASGVLYGSADDTALAGWMNYGDLQLDRTIFVRVRDLKSGREDLFYTTVHRTERQFVATRGIVTSGCMDLGNTWKGDAYDGCVGDWVSGSNSGLPGSVQSPCIVDFGSDFNLEKVESAVDPPPPSAAYKLGEETNIHSCQACTPYPDVNATTTIGSAGGGPNPVPWKGFLGGAAYRVDDFNISGAKVVTLDVSRGYVHVYVHGVFSTSGNVEVNKVAYPKVVDDFDLDVQYDTDKRNDMYAAGCCSTNGTGFTTNDVAGGELRLSYGSPTAWWYSSLTPSAVYNALGYRYLRLRLRGAAGGESFKAGLVYRPNGTGAEVTVTADVSSYLVGTSVGVHDFAFKNMQPVMDPKDISFTSRVVLTDFVGAGGSPSGTIYLNSVEILRHGGNDCCLTEDAVIYVLNDTALELSGGGTYNMLLWAPDSSVTVGGSGSGAFSGAIIAKSFQTTGGGSGWFHYDACLANSADEVYEEPPIITTSWRQVGKRY